MNMLYYLLYISYAEFAFKNKDIRDLILKSNQNNNKHDITGMLLYIDGKFIQLLEGRREHVLNLFDKIERDPRHQKVSVILEGPLEERSFADWNMGLKIMDKDLFEQLSGYKDINVFFESTSINNQSHPAMIFLRLFYQKNYRDLADNPSSFKR